MATMTMHKQGFLLFNYPITFDKDTKKQTSSFKTRYISLSFHKTGYVSEKKLSKLIFLLSTFTIFAINYIFKKVSRYEEFYLRAGYR